MVKYSVEDYDLAFNATHGVRRQGTLVPTAQGAHDSNLCSENYKKNVQL